MRILLLTQWFQPEPMLKGLPFARGLSTRGHAVEVLTGFPNYPGGKLYSGYSVRPWLQEMMEGIKINRVPLYPSHSESGLHRIINYLSFALSSFLLGPWLVQKPNVVYVYNLITLIPTAIVFRFLFRSKILLDVQDLWPESVTSSGLLRSNRANRLLMAISVWAYCQADWIVVLSPGFKQALIHRGVPQDRIEVIYNWCDEYAQRPMPRDEILAEQVGMAGRFNVLFAGTMGVMQELDTVLEAAKLCRTVSPTVQFVFVGGGVDRQRLEAQAVEMKLDNVRFLPRQQPEDMGRFYALADALLVHLKDDPLFRITIPSKTQTYLHMGKPIIMAMSGDASDLVKRAGAGLISSSGDAGDLVYAVQRLVALSKEEREQMGKSGVQFYQRYLSMQVGIDAFEQRVLAMVETE